MADRDISIGIKTTADTAAVKQAEVALEGLENQARQTDAALDGVAGSAGGAVSSAGSRRGKGAAAAIKEIAEETPKAAAGSRNFGAAIGQAGFQVQDFAVQVGAGTSALTAFAQQGSQLLGLFGPGGAIAGALLAVGAIAYRTFQATQEGGEESAAAAEELAAALEEAAKEAAKLNAEMGQGSAETFVQRLGEEAASYRKLNEEVARNIELMQARRRAQAEIESAQAALDLARIDADPNLSEEEKIRRRAGVQEGIEQGRLRDRLAGIGERVARAQAEAETARAGVSPAQAAAEKARRQLEDEEQAAAALRERVAAADKAKSTGIAEAEKKANQARENEAALYRDGGLPSRQQGIEALKAIEEAEKRLAEQRAIAASATDEDRARLNQLDGAANQPGSIAALTKGLADLVKAAEDAVAAANAAGTKRDRVVADASIEAEGAVNSFELGRQTRGVGTSARVREAQERERERREREERKRAGDDLSNRESGLDDAARGVAKAFAGAAGRGASRGVDGGLVKTLEDIAKKLSDGTNEAELARLREQFNQATQGIGGATLAALRDMLATQQAQAREIESLRAAIKRKGDAGS